MHRYTEVHTGPACAEDLRATKDMSPHGCVPGCSQGEPTQTHIWDSNLLAWASSSAPCKSRKLIFLVVGMVFPWKAILYVMLKCRNQIKKKKKNTGVGKSFPLIFYPVLNHFTFNTLLAKFSRG